MKAVQREKGLLSRLRSQELLADGEATGSGHPPAAVTAPPAPRACPPGALRSRVTSLSERISSRISTQLKKDT